MSDDTQTTTNDQNVQKQAPGWVRAFNSPPVKFVVDILIVFFKTIRSFIYLIVKTPYTLLPSAAHTTMDDKVYNDELAQQLREQIDLLGDDLSRTQKTIIQENWIEQIRWTNDRANRERDANELIRWWLIILGVLIPVLNAAGGTSFIFGLPHTTIVSIAGVLVAFLTAIAQFRRPEDRWRHYRMVSERYQNELWNYITLSGESYAAKEGEPLTHATAFNTFHGRMTQIKQEDVNKFFGEVIQNNQQETTLSTATVATSNTIQTPLTPDGTLFNQPLPGNGTQSTGKPSTQPRDADGN